MLFRTDVNNKQKLCTLERGFGGAKWTKKRINLGTDVTSSKTETWQYRTLKVSLLVYGEWNASTLISWPYSRISGGGTTLCMNYWPHPARFDLCKHPLLQLRTTTTWRVAYWCRISIISVRKAWRIGFAFWGITSRSEYLKWMLYF